MKLPRDQKIEVFSNVINCLNMKLRVFNDEQ